MPDISNIQLNGNSVTVDKIILDGVTLPLDGGGGGGDTAMKENVQGTLTSYTIPNDVTSIRNGAFHSCSSLTSVTIHNSVATIGDSAFNDCDNLTSITIPNGVTKINNYTFNGCTNLTSITIPNGVTEIGMSAFSNCRILQTITIPSNVTKINGSAFSKCYSLKYAKFSGLTPPYIGSYSNQLEYMQDILVPQSAVSDYVTAFPLWENRIFADTHTHDYSVTELRYSDQTGSTPFTLKGFISEIM